MTAVALALVAIVLALTAIALALTFLEPGGWPEEPLPCPTTMEACR